MNDGDAAVVSASQLQDAIVRLVQERDEARARVAQLEAQFEEEQIVLNGVRVRLLAKRNNDEQPKTDGEAVARISQLQDTIARLVQERDEALAALTHEREVRTELGRRCVSLGVELELIKIQHERARASDEQAWRNEVTRAEKAERELGEARADCEAARAEAMVLAETLRCKNEGKP